MLADHQLYSLHPLSGGGDWDSDQIFKKGGGLDRISIFRGQLLGKRGWPFQGGCRFYRKSKLKSEYLMTKKVYQQKVFLFIKTKDWNWEIQSKNLVTFKRWHEVKNEKSLILWGFTEKSDF